MSHLPPAASVVDSSREAPKDRWRTPRLRINSEVEGVNHASWIELFFDLVFVVVIEELGHYLSEHFTLLGFGQFVALFVPCWWAWVLFTFYIDRYDADDVTHRVLILTGMLAAISLAANVHNAFSTGTTGFVLSYVALRSLVWLLYFRATRYVSVAWVSLRLYSASYVPSAVLWIASLAVAGTERYILWVIALGVELLMPILGSRLLAKTPVHPSHLPERFGLFTLIVLGEAIVSVAAGTQNTTWNQLPMLAAVGGFMIAACLWWLYFSFLESSVVIRGMRSVHIFNYGHFPILVALATIAIGVGHAISEVNNPTFSDATRWALCGGVALYMTTIMTILMTSCRRRVKPLSILVIVGSLALAALGGSLPPIAVEGLLLVLLLAKVRADALYVPPTPEPTHLAPIEQQEVP